MMFVGNAILHIDVLVVETLSPQRISGHKDATVNIVSQNGGGLFVECPNSLNNPHKHERNGGRCYK